LMVERKVKSTKSRHYEYVASSLMAMKMEDLSRPQIVTTTRLEYSCERATTGGDIYVEDIIFWR
jgi:hypothetical protein